MKIFKGLIFAIAMAIIFSLSGCATVSPSVTGVNASADNTTVPSDQQTSQANQQKLVQVQADLKAALLKAQTDLATIAASPNTVQAINTGVMVAGIIGTGVGQPEVGPEAALAGALLKSVNVAIVANTPIHQNK